MNFFERAILPVVFLLSGFAALVYQVAWQRMLVVFAGGDLFSITLVVSAFLAGLGGGSWLGGRLADRHSRRACLRWFAAAELLVGGFGFLSPWLYHEVLSAGLSHWAASRWTTAGALLAALLVPTLLMGASLPLLARAVVRNLPEAARRIGWLHGVNTLGAATGALIATWALLPLLGLAGSVRCAAVLNLVCAAVVVPLGFRRGDLAATACESPSPQVDGGSRATSLPEAFARRRWWFLLAAASGFLALSLELLWFRLLGVAIKSTAFTFGTLLAAYLAGLALGSLAGARLVSRWRRPGAVYLLLQTGIGIYAALTAVGLVACAGGSPGNSAFQTYLAGYEPLDVNQAWDALLRSLAGAAGAEEQMTALLFAQLYGVLPVVMVSVPTFLMGAAFPCLQRMVQTDLAWVGRGAGSLQAANLLGCLLGAGLTGAILLHSFGTAAMLAVIAAASAGFTLLNLCFFSRDEPAWFRGFQISMIVAALAAAAGLPANGQLWARLHGGEPAGVIATEDGSGVSALKVIPPSSARPGHTAVFVNGIGQSWIPYGGIHTALGALPALIHPGPRDIAIIGLGSGDTVFGAAGRAETERVVCVEIVGAQHAGLRRLAAEWPDPGLVAMLHDPRIRHVTDDGRRFLTRTRDRFDLIEADALRPTSAGAGNLYSVEYFDLVRRRLKPGGLAVTWGPTPRTQATFVRVFPHVLICGPILLGGNDPIPFDPDLLRQRLADPALRAHFARAGIDPETLLAPYLGASASIGRFDPTFDRSSLTNLNTDLFPRDEFSLPSLWPRP